MINNLSFEVDTNKDMVSGDVLEIKFDKDYEIIEVL